MNEKTMMTTNQDRNSAGCIHLTRLITVPLAGALAMAMTFGATGAHAQEDRQKDGQADSSNDSTKGLYGVARAGAVVGVVQKFDASGLPADSPFDANIHNKVAPTGELGVGYNFGMFRLEQTFGYTGLSPSNVNSGSYTGNGRSNAFTLAVSGYVDIPTGTALSPYVGVGVGAARVQSNLTRTDQNTGSYGTYDGNKFGLLWHADAGVGYRLSKHVTAEFGGRYTSISNLSFAGDSSQGTTTYKPKLGYWSALGGIRYAF